MNRLPKRVIVSLSPFYETFINSPGVDGNQQVYSEITRQIFDALDNSFEVFTKMIEDLPRVVLLINSEYLLSNPEALQTLKANIKEFALGIYFMCIKDVIIINQTFPYLLETVKDDMCILFLNEDYEYKVQSLFINERV